MAAHSSVGVFAGPFVGTRVSLVDPAADARPGSGCIRTPPGREPATAANRPRRTVGSVPDHVRPQAHQPQRRRSIVHHYPYPYPGAYNNDETAGFRNPGGVGGMPSTILPATASRSRAIPCAWPSSAWAATPARRTDGGPAGRHLAQQFASSSTSTTTRCPATATASAWAASAASGEPPSRGRPPDSTPTPRCG